MDLPYEIQRQVLEMVLHGCFKSITSTRKGHSYAIVCRDWQEFFEEESFRRLVLTQMDLKAFKRIVRSRRGFVKQIWLRILLPKYECVVSCDQPESGPCIASNNNRIGSAIYRFFDILSTWSKKIAIGE